MDADTIAEGRRLLAVVDETHAACNRDSTEATRAEVLMARVDRDTFLRNHARELLAAAEQREAILALARQHCHPGANPGAHGLASKILQLAGER